MALTQTQGDAPPLPPGKTVLRIGTDDDPSVLLHDLASAQNTLHCRFMLNASQASGGTIVLAGGIDDAGKSAWHLVVDCDGRTVTLEIEQAQLTASVSDVLDWHCIEVGLDVNAGSATLRIDGIERDTATTPVRSTRYTWLGGAFQSIDMTGHLSADQWALATEPIGVPTSDPIIDHAGDPRRWLVVYNRSDPDSAAWVNTYRERRGIPYANLCGLNLSASETITPAEFETMRQQIADYLDDNHLHGQVVGLLLGFGVPGYADLTGQGEVTPISSYLQTDDTHGFTVVNPLYQGAIDQRPTAPDFGGIRLTGRIDAPTLGEAIAMIDRADGLTTNPLAHDVGGELFVDINPDNLSVGPIYTQPVADWAQGEGLPRLRLPSTVFNTNAPAGVSNDAVVWGWRDAAPPAGFFGSPAGRRAICLQLSPMPEPAESLRDPGATHWLRTAIDAGYAYAAAGSRAFALSSLPLPHLFFEALRQRWTVAEAWLVSQPFLRDGLQVVGDPLMPIPFPKAGYDVFGPTPRLDRIDFDAPLARLHAGETTLALQSSGLPQPGATARYLVRAIDAEGRSDQATASAFCAMDSGQAVRPAMPAWPVDGAWPVLQRGAQLVFSAIWPASLRSLGIAAVRLELQINDDDPVCFLQTTPAIGQRRVVFAIDRPNASARYRFAWMFGSAAFHSPWSEEVAPTSDPHQSLTVLETSP